MINQMGEGRAVRLLFTCPDACVCHPCSLCTALLILKPAGGRRELKLPSDIEAVDWTRMDPQGQWKSRLMEAFRKAGLIT